MDIFAANMAATASGFSGLSPFPDPAVLTMPQILFMTCMYCYILFQAAHILTYGSELLLLVPNIAPLVGSVVLPILGAVPDGMMIFFSGLGDDAQNKVSVGIGALAGSTVMLLTLPWFVSIVAGRVTIKGGSPTYKRPANVESQSWEKLDPRNKWTLLSTGVGYDDSIRTGGRMMMCTTLGYFIIQFSAFQVDSFTKDASPQEMRYESGSENMFALAGLIICMVEFVYYLWVCWRDANSESGAIVDQIADANVQAMREGKLTLRGAMAQFRERNWKSLCKRGELDQVLLNKESLDEVRRMCKMLAPFFAHYDSNGDNQIDFEEFRMIFKDVNECLSREAQQQMFKAADTDDSKFISFEEFVACIMSFSMDPSNDLKELEKRRYKANPKKYLDTEAGCDPSVEGDDDDDEEEDMPEEFAHLEPEEQQKRIKSRALCTMVAGLALVLIFSDPTVDLLSEIGTRINVSPFYVSFVLAPVASNASEFVAAYVYAVKRTRPSMTTSLSALVGAAIMNNTFCLGIFLALIYFKGLAWRFTAETISIVVIQIIMGLLVVFRNTHTLMHGFVVLALYPASLLLVWLLENQFGLD